MHFFSIFQLLSLERLQRPQLFPSFVRYMQNLLPRISLKVDQPKKSSRRFLTPVFPSSRIPRLFFKFFEHGLSVPFYSVFCCDRVRPYRVCPLRPLYAGRYHRTFPPLEAPFSPYLLLIFFGLPFKSTASFLVPHWLYPRAGLTPSDMTATHKPPTPLASP